MENLFSIRIKGEILKLDRTIIMGVLNSTPDSFYKGSRVSDSREVKERIVNMKANGVDWIDVGGYSSRPGAEDIPVNEEKERLSRVLTPLAEHFPEIPVSVDTFRAEVAHWAVQKYQVAIINDISGAHADPEILDVAAQENVPFIGMHMRGTPQTMTQFTQYDDVMREMTLYFAELIEKAHLKGVNDVIIDPGFGFAKGTESNYTILNHLNELSILDKPILVGMSRKSMIYKYLGIEPEDALYGTVALHTLAIAKGASIIRAHDIIPAVQMARVVDKTLKN